MKYSFHNVSSKVTNQCLGGLHQCYTCDTMTVSFSASHSEFNYVIGGRKKGGGVIILYRGEYINIF